MELSRYEGGGLAGEFRELASYVKGGMVPGTQSGSSS